MVKSQLPFFTNIASKLYQSNFFQNNLYKAINAPFNIAGFFIDKKFPIVKPRLLDLFAKSNKETFERWKGIRSIGEVVSRNRNSLGKLESYHILFGNNIDVVVRKMPEQVGLLGSTSYMNDSDGPYYLIKLFGSKGLKGRTLYHELGHVFSLHEGIIPLKGYDKLKISENIKAEIFSEAFTSRKFKILDKNISFLHGVKYVIPNKVNEINNSIVMKAVSFDKMVDKSMSKAINLVAKAKLVPTAGMTLVKNVGHKSSHQLTFVAQMLKNLVKRI